MISAWMHTGPHAGKRARLREPRGVDELRAADGDTVGLLRGLLVPAGDTDVAADRVGELTLSDRDRLLAALYVHAFGDRVECRWVCARCREPFELTLSMRALVEQTFADAEPGCTRDEHGHYATAAGTRFRLPNLDDHACLDGLPSDRVEHELWRRCVAYVADGDDIDALMSAVGPLLDVELAASCPSCAEAQSVPFEIQRYFHAATARERPWLTREVHRLASAYGWSLAEILDLPRSLRREHVALVDADRTARRRPA